MTTKTDFASRVVGMASALANITDNLDILQDVYTARNYQGTITQADLDALGITLAAFNETLGVIARFGQFMAGQAVVDTDNRSIVNRIRTDI